MHVRPEEHHRPGTPGPVRVPRGLRVAAALSWRLLVVAAALVVVWQAVTTLADVVIPAAVAGLLAALLAPLVRWLTMRGVPRTLAAVVVLVGGLAAVGGVLAVVVGTVVNGWPELQLQVAQSVESLHQWLRNGPLHLSDQQLAQMRDQATDTLRSSQGEVATKAVTTAGTVASVLGGLLLGLFTLLFLLRDAGRIWRFMFRVCVPERLQARVDVAGRRAFAALVAYVRATALVAFMDALGVGVGAALVGVPLAPVLAALVFLGAFVPYLGSVLAGIVAVLVALATQGLASGLIVLAVVVVVMQLEGHVLQPLLLGRAVNLHPLGVVLSITAGFVVGGAAGAVFAVPVVTVVAVSARSWSRDHGEPHAVDPYRPQHSQPA